MFQHIVCSLAANRHGLFIIPWQHVLLSCMNMAVDSSWLFQQRCSSLFVHQAMTEQSVPTCMQQASQQPCSSLSTGENKLWVFTCVCIYIYIYMYIYIYTCVIMASLNSKALAKQPNIVASIDTTDCCIQNCSTVYHTRSSNNFWLIKCWMKFDFHQTYCPTYMFDQKMLDSCIGKKDSPTPHPHHISFNYSRDLI